MIKPPLSVKKYFFPYVEVAADAEFDPTKEMPSVSFETKVAVEKAPDDDIYQVMLEITVFPESEEKRIPYSIHIIAVGLFSVDKQMDDPEKLLKVNGASILYSSAREFVITVTSRGPWPAVMLPTVSFLPPEKNNPETIKSKLKKDKIKNKK